MDSRPATVEAIVGLLLRSSFRKSLGKVAFLHPEFSWYEEKNILDSTFTLRGPYYILRAIENKMKGLED